MQKLDRITQDPAVMNGGACIRGMRVTVGMIVSQIAAGRTADDDAVHWISVGAVTAANSEIMDFARDHDRIVLTHDLDFSVILAATRRSAPSVIQVRADDVSPKAIGRVVLGALAAAQEALTAGALATIDARRTRLRWPPL